MLKSENVGKMGNMLPLLSSSVYTSKGTGCNPTVYDSEVLLYFAFLKYRVGMFSAVWSLEFSWNGPTWPGSVVNRWFCCWSIFDPMGNLQKKHHLSERNLVGSWDYWTHGYKDYFLSHELRVLIHILFSNQDRVSATNAHFIYERRK